jgi:ribonuclease VapC
VSSSKVVLDASALLAYLQDEPGHEKVEEILQKAVINTVNLAEVITKLIRDGFTEAEVVEILEAFPIETASLSASVAHKTGCLFQETREFGLSLGDRACLAFAIEQKIPVFTTDRAWAKFDFGIQVNLIR